MPKRPEHPDLVTFLRSLDGRVRQVERHKHPVGEADEAQVSPSLKFDLLEVSRSTARGDPTFSVLAGTPTDIPFTLAGVKTESSELVASSVELDSPSFHWDSTAPTRVVALRRVQTVVHCWIAFSFASSDAVFHTYTVTLLVNLEGTDRPDSLLSIAQPRQALILPVSGGVVLDKDDYYVLRMLHAAGATANVSDAVIRIKTWTL